MPYSARTARWPSTVAPPWLPIAGTTNGSAPTARSSSATVRMTVWMSAMPRLPAVIATRCPGAILLDKLALDQRLADRAGDVAQVLVR